MCQCEQVCWQVLETQNCSYRYSKPLTTSLGEVKNCFFLRLADIKAPIANDKSPFMRLCHCPNLLLTSQQQCLA